MGGFAGGVVVGIVVVVDVCVRRRDDEEGFFADDLQVDTFVVDRRAEDGRVEFVGVDLFEESFGEVFLDGEFGVGVAVSEC